MEAFIDRISTNRRAGFVWLFLLAGLLPLAMSPAAVAAQPALDLFGLWKVEHLSNDIQATRKLSLEQDDPRVVGRFLDIGRDRVRFSMADGDLTCASPTFRAEQTTAGKLIASTMGERGYPPVTPRPEDYKLPLAPWTQVQVIWLSCTSGGVGPGFGGHRNAWFLDLPEHRLAMGSYGSTVLVLDSVPSGTLPEASFACVKAATLTERAICGSRDLASLDRSVADSYGIDLDAFERDGDTVAASKLKAFQERWLVVRDRCGGDDGCLRKTLNARLQLLTDTASQTGE